MSAEFVMQRILDKLAARADAAPDDALLNSTLAVLRDIQRRPHGPHSVSWDALSADLDRLRECGFWEHTVEDDELLDALRVLLTSRPTIAIPPASANGLPVELVELLNNAYFLHVLATDPAQALPPGKSLLSAMTRTLTAADAAKPTLHSKVQDIVHRAFWDVAVHTLSNPEPSAQLPRIKLLYTDLHVALSPLLPPGHPVLVTLSSPLSPTSSPLDSAVMHLREVLASLRQRCAPVRDLDVDALQRTLDRPPASGALVAETVRHILELSDVMKDDLSQFFLGSMTEQQLASVVASQARETEREFVIDVWHRDGIVQGWTSWLDTKQPPAQWTSVSAEPRFLWIVRTVQALGSSLPVSCPLPGHHSESNANTLPPAFFLSTPTLLKVQNHLQALVIAASLNVLARPPAHARSEPDSFMSRTWTLLRAEIAGEPDAGDTKLIHLADEVVRARTRAGTLSTEDEAALRAAVDRTLRYEDPVYKLLHRRLLTELSNVLLKRRQGDATRDIGAGPATLRTGMDGERAGKRPRLVLDLEDEWRTPPPRSAPGIIAHVQGFEDPVLSQAVAEVFQTTEACLEWVQSIWEDVVEA